MKQYFKRMMLALMVSIGVMGAMGVQAQAQEKAWVRVDDYCVFSINYSRCGSLDEICRDYVSFYSSGSVQFNGHSELKPGYWPAARCFFNQYGGGVPPEASINFNPGCKVGRWSTERPDGCYEQRDNCPEGTVNEGGVCVPEKQCQGDLVKDENGNCTCPEGEERVRLWGDNQCEPKCPEGQERDENGECACTFGFVKNENGVCECPEGFEPFAQQGARSAGAQQCVRKCDDGEVRRNGVCVKLPYEPYKNPAVCSETKRHLDGNDYADLGAVACLDSSNKGVCFWPESHIDQDTKNPNWDDLDLVAQGIIQDCVVEHERYHYNDTGYCNFNNRWSDPTEINR